MQTPDRMKYADALVIAERIVDHLRPVCERIEIAGSLRRKREDVHDIDLVLTPRFKTNLDMFGNPTTSHSLLDEQLRGLGTLKKNGPRQKQILLPEGIHCELWIVLPPAQWGAIMVIRTGPGDYGRWLVTSKREGGALPSHLKEKGGALWNSTTMLETPEEGDFFRALGLAPVAPAERRAKWVGHIVSDESLL